jgi:hypothetical protein
MNESVHTAGQSINGAMTEATASCGMSSIEFLKLVLPEDAWSVLVAIHPTTGTCVGIGVSRLTLDEVPPWIERHKEWNLYWSPNSLASRLDKKPLKTELAHMRYVHADLDDPSDGALASIRGHRLAPTMIVRSGGGFNGYWALREPQAINGNLESLEAANKRMIADLNADKGTWNVDRILRLPGTTNWPTKKKLERGRVPVPAELVEYHPERLYDLRDFPPLSLVTDAAATNVVAKAAKKADGNLKPQIIDVVSPPATATGGFDGTDPQLIEMARAAKNGPKFAALFDGVEGSKAYSSLSESDEALIAILGFWCGPDPGRIELLMWQSKRHRDKWDTTRGTDHGEVSYLHYEIDRWLETHRDGPFYRTPSADKTTVRFLAGPDLAILTDAEIAGIPPEPPVIVAGYLLEDCGGFAAPGGAGKTTLGLFESIHIILGRPLWGREIEKTGNVLFITAEDSRRMTAYRLNCMCTAMGLSAAERERVRCGFFCEDLSDKIGARLVAMVRGEVAATTLPDEIIERYRNRDLSYVHLDPTSLLGPGEITGNDGMTELMRAGRMVSRALRASVRNIHHVSQQVARGGIQDQHVGRGGTAFADNARFIHQLVVVKSRKFPFEGTDFMLPTEATDEDMQRGRILAVLIHKVSYMERQNEPIFIRREGFRYEHLQVNLVGSVAPLDLGAADAELLSKISNYLALKLEDSVRYSASTIEDCYAIFEVTRATLRRVRDDALQTGALEEVDLPPNLRRGKRKTFLRPKAELHV